MKFEELLNHLFEIADKKFADFSKSLSNSDYISIGVKNPILKQLVKDHIKDEELKTEDFELGKYLEVDYIYFGLSLNRLNRIEEQLEFLEKNIYKAKSWAITDTASTYLKNLSFDNYWKFFKTTNDSKYTFTRRMAYILGLKVYKEKEILKILDYIKPNEEYMVMMAQAWLLATIAICYPDEIFEYLSSKADITLKRKTISKMCDSFRIPNDVKDKFKTLR